MKFEDLMLNDWVQINPDDYSTRGEWINTKYRIMHYRELDDDEIRPIPLTGEILLDNGFVACSSNRYMNNNNSLDVIIRKNYVMVCRGSSKVQVRNKEVHSFQQLLRLLGLVQYANNLIVK